MACDAHGSGPAFKNEHALHANVKNRKKKKKLPLHLKGGEKKEEEEEENFSGVIEK